MAMFSQGGWSDSSLAAVEDFSSLLLAMDGARRYMTSGSLSSSLLTTAPTVHDMVSTQDSGALYSNAVPVIRDTGPHYVMDDAASEAFEAVSETAPAVAYDDVLDVLDVPTVADAPADTMPWGEETSAETWDAESMMTAVDAPPSDEMSSMATDQEMSWEAPAELQSEPEAVAELYAAVEPQAPVEFQVPLQPLAPVELDEGTFAGQTIEFESFMFNGGRTSSPSLMNMALSGTEVDLTPPPAPQPPTPSMQAPTNVTSPSNDASNEELPFWLKNTGELSMPSQAMPTVEAEAPVMEMPSAPQVVSEDYIDYSDLPPHRPLRLRLTRLERRG